MSEIQTPKLNLKALKVDIPVEELAPDPSLSMDESVVSDEIKTLVDKDTDTIEESSENTTAKMSFASIRKEVEEVEEAEEEPIKEEKEEALSENNLVDTPPITDISLELKQGGENSVATEEKKADVVDTKDGTIEEKEPAEKIVQSPEEIEVILQGAEDAVIEKKKKKRFFGIFKRKEKKSKEVSQEIPSTEEKEPEEVKFTNYESHFTKESSNFLSKFQKFKYTAKTRVGLLLSLVVLTTAVIGGLMIMIPEKHSPEIYTASIMQILGKEVPPIKTTPLEIEERPEENEVGKDTPNTTGEDIPNEELKDTVPEVSIQEKSKEKLRQHLLNKYSE